MQSTGTRCAVLGSPIAHSLSPTLHRAAYAELGLSGWTYDAVEVTVTGLAEFLDGLDASWRGLSLTMPLKRTVLPLADEVSSRARLAGAANTVVLQAGRRVVDNTDIPGAVAALRERYDGPVDSAMVLGGGATATSLLLALTELGCREAVLAVREPARATETVEAVGRHPDAPRLEVVRLDEVGAATARACDVLVSTVPAAAQTPDLVGRLPQPAVTFEVVYDPWPTPLAAAAAGPLVSGLDLLVHQAVLQVELMTGQSVGVEVLRRAGESALAERAGDRT